MNRKKSLSLRIHKCNARTSESKVRCYHLIFGHFEALSPWFGFCCQRDRINMYFLEVLMFLLWIEIWGSLIKVHYQFSQSIELKLVSIPLFWMTKPPTTAISSSSSTNMNWKQRNNGRACKAMQWLIVTEGSSQTWYIT